MTDNQQRAAERNIQTAREILVACNVQPQFVPTVVAAIGAALDEAEARGRAEVAEKVVDLIDGSEFTAYVKVGRLRTLAAEVAPL